MASNGEPDSLAVMKRGYTSARKADSLSAGRRGMEPRAHRPCPPLRLGSLDGIVKAFTERGIPLRQANYERGIPSSPQCLRSLSPQGVLIPLAARRVTNEVSSRLSCGD